MAKIRRREDSTVLSPDKADSQRHSGFQLEALKNFASIHNSVFIGDGHLALQLMHLR
jgi:hypothetical protein